MNASNEWSITCRDVAGRRRELTVMINADRVVIVAPPGEMALLAPHEVGRLRAALRDAAVGASVGTQVGEEAQL